MFIQNLYLTYIIYFACAVIFSLFINKIFLEFATTLGIRKKNGNNNIVRWNNTQKPSLGGISFFIIYLLSMTFSNILLEGENVFFTRQMTGLIGAVTLAFLMGLADDAYDTIPLLKFFSQLCCGIILISTGTYIQLFDNTFLNYAISVLWVIGIMNAINMLDNMDSISAIVSGFILLTTILLIFIYCELNHVYMFVIVGVLAALVGFLFFNWYPAKIYMGDTGSQFIGVFLAATGIIYFWNFNKVVISDINLSEITPVSLTIRKIVAVALIFAIPIVDTTTVVINRLLAKQSPFIGGKDHTTHHLCFSGISDRGVALLIAVFSFICCGVGLWVIDDGIEWGASKGIMASLCFVVIFFALFLPTQKRRNIETTNK